MDIATKCLSALCLGAVLGIAWGADRPEPPTRIERPQPVQVASVDHVIQARSSQSVDLDALRRAFSQGGSIAFDTGGKPVVIPIAEQLVMSQHAKPIVMDGGGLVTFDGLERSRIIDKEWKTELTVQRCSFVNARADKEGGAIHSAWDGRLTVIDCDFRNCKTTSTGPDIGGGAIRTTGQKHLLIAGCTFVDCAGSNGGAVCDIGSQKSIIDCTFQGCVAFGTGGGADAGPNGQGGIGGAVYGDGVDQSGGTPMWYFEDCLFMGNRAYDHAGAVFAYTRPNQPNVTIFAGCMFVDNAVERPDGSTPHIKHGGAVYNQYTELHVIGCSFVDNRTPGIGAMMFTAGMRGTHCTFSDAKGNQGGGAPYGGGDMKSLGSPPAAVVWNGGKPGKPLPEERVEQREQTASTKDAEREAKRAERDAKRASSKVNASKIAAEVEAGWRERLAAQLAARIEAGADLRFDCAMMGGKEATLRSVDDQRLTLATREMALPLGWERVQDADLLALARLLATDEASAEDHAVISWYEFRHGDLFRAKEHLVQAGELQAQLEADLGR